MPWLLPAKPITSSTIARVSGQKRSAQRIDIPPWLWPITDTRRPERRWMRRIACTRYSPATWMSFWAWPGIVRPHQGIPRAVSERM